MTRRNFWRGMLLFLCAAAVYSLGHYVGGLSERRSLRGGKLDRVMKLIRTAYVDTVDVDKLESDAIPMVLSHLDPHSAYLSKELNTSEVEKLDGSFSGIGVQFNTVLDTPVVVKVIPGGPSERAGIQAGDRILRADGFPLFGEKLDSKEIISKLKGPRKSVVKLDILREGKSVEAKVLRDDVPVPTVEASYMAAPGVLFVKLNGWGLQTHGEVLTSYAKHKPEGVEGIVIDLRNNGGGYLEAATSLSSEFLPKNKLILYADGNAFSRQDIRSTRDGLLKDVPLVVLLDEFSASSSEIFAGAMQDHDRALIVGRRSFGKGLVQRPFMLPDSSVVRLTVARYYTPSGRCIQKQYDPENYDGYVRDIQDRYLHGELFNADSIRFNDSLRYFTEGKRVVYGGGGITPDVFVPRDSSGITSYYIRLIDSEILPKFAFLYADGNRAMLSQAKNVEELTAMLDAQGVLYKLTAFAQKENIQMRTTLFKRSFELLRTNLYALIADYFFDREGLYLIMYEKDEALSKAVDAINEGKTYPVMSEDKRKALPGKGV
ncbi:S41 family peptidase [Porphyromonas macacae]|uniref:Probable CtpA-like serine protease n=1 Tax=Porphyromonas macacae TaxID=28115 RepID=A0A379DFG1_9PORP|nr:S41 family peptidase [Porphyromonas macacae]SUB77096.1 Probable CtpA-like serine protease [Porphyromonas macacae]